MADYGLAQADANRAWELADPATRDPNGAANMDPTRTRWETNKDKINAYLQSVQNDPAFKLAQSRGEAGIESFLHERGYGIVPTEAKYDPETGQVQDKSWWDKHKHWAIPGMIMGGAIAAPLAIGALTGGGSTAVGSTTGLAGSGFGTGGGLGLTGVGGAAGTGGAGLASTVLPQALSTLPAGGSTLGTTAGGGWAALAGKYAKPVAGALNSMANTAAQNRGVELGANQLADQVATQRQAENRTEREDAWKKLQNADYAQHTQGYTNPRGLPTYGIARTGPMTPDVLRGSEGLESEAMQRLVNGPQLKPLTDVGKYAKPGGWEKLAGYGGLAASFFAR